MAILLVCSTLIWGFQTSWGSVKIKRLNLTSQDGTTVSSLIYIPKNATDETPAPVAVIYHGRSNHAHSNDTWSMELARRGYVVLSPDLQGGGESDPSVDRSIQAKTVAEYANSLSYVEKDAINLIGYSAGTQTVLQTYKAMPDQVKSICEVFGPFMIQMAGGIDDVDTDFCLIKSDADQYDYFFIGDPQACTDYVTKASGLPEVVSGQDYDRNGKLFRYSEIGGTLHQTGNISGETIQAILSFEAAVNNEPVARTVDDTAWLPQQIFSGIACVTMMFLLAALVNLLMQNPFFASAANPVPVKVPRKGAKAWVLDALFAVVIPIILFVPVSAYVMVWTGAGTPWSKFLTSANLNGIMGWLLVVRTWHCADDFCRIQTEKRRKAEASVRVCSGRSGRNTHRLEQTGERISHGSDLCNLRVCMAESAGRIPWHQLSGMEPFYLFKNEPDADSSRNSVCPDHLYRYVHWKYEPACAAVHW